MNDSIVSTWERSQVSTWKHSKPSALYPKENPYTIATLYLYSLLLYCKPTIYHYTVSLNYIPKPNLCTLSLHWKHYILLVLSSIASSLLTHFLGAASSLVTHFLI